MFVFRQAAAEPDGPAPLWTLLGVSGSAAAAQAPAANAEIRDEQDDKDHDQDDVKHWASKFCAAITVPASVLSDFGEGSYPSGGFASDVGVIREGLVA